MDEAFVVWREGKVPNDYNMYFRAVYKPEHYGKNPTLWGWVWLEVVSSWI